MRWRTSGVAGALGWSVMREFPGEPGHRAAEGGADRVSGRVAAAFDLLPAADPDAIDGRRAGEDPGVEHGVAGAAGSAGCRGVERDEIGRRARGDAAGRGAERLRAAGERRIEQRAPGRAAGSRQHVARAVRKPLRIFELPQLVGDADQHVGIGADAEAAAGRR